MDKKNIHTIFEHSDCLSEQKLLDYNNNLLSNKERNNVERHTINCKFCSDALEGFELQTQNNSTYLKFKTEFGSTKKQYKSIIISITGIAAAIVMGIFLFDSKEIDPTRTAEHETAKPSEEQKTKNAEEETTKTKEDQVFKNSESDAITDSISEGAYSSSLKPTQPADSTTHKYNWNVKSELADKETRGSDNLKADDKYFDINDEDEFLVEEEKNNNELFNGAGKEAIAKKLKVEEKVAQERKKIPNSTTVELEFEEKSEEAFLVKESAPTNVNNDSTSISLNGIPVGNKEEPQAINEQISLNKNKAIRTTQTPTDESEELAIENSDLDGEEDKLDIDNENDDIESSADNETDLVSEVSKENDKIQSKDINLAEENSETQEKVSAPQKDGYLSDQSNQESKSGEISVADSIVSYSAIQSGIALYTQKEYKTAITQLLKVDVKDSSYYKAQLYIGKCYVMLKNNTKATPYLNEALKGDSKIKAEAQLTLDSIK